MHLLRGFLHLSSNKLRYREMRGVTTGGVIAAAAVSSILGVDASGQALAFVSNIRCRSTVSPHYDPTSVRGEEFRKNWRSMVSTFSNDDTILSDDDRVEYVLPYENSAHNSATITIPSQESEDFCIETFRDQLGATCSVLRELEKSSVWIEVPMSRARFIEETIDLGFAYHHAEGNMAKLNKWLREDTESKVPEYATHHVGVGAVVINSREEILCVRELRKNYMPWKVPGGLSELGETIADAAEREVMEETGIPTSFHSVIGFRHTHGLANGRSDVYFVCRLDPIEECDENGNVIIPDPCAQACEIEATAWVPLKEYRDMVNGVDGGSGHPMMRNIMRIYDSGLEISPREVKSVVPGRKPNPLYVPSSTLEP